MDEQESQNTKHGVLILGTAIGTSALKTLIRGELRQEDGTTLFLMGIIDPTYPYANGEVTEEKLFELARTAIVEYVEENGQEIGVTYYGEMMSDGRFYVNGTDKPEWEDGSWGHRADI